MSEERAPYGGLHQPEIENYKRTIFGLLSDRPVSYHPMLAKLFGGVGPGLFLCQLLYWSDRGWDPGGWIYKTQSEFTDETGLSRKEQETARRHLVKHGILQEERRGIPAKLYYRLDLDVLIDKLVAQFALEQKAGATTWTISVSCNSSKGKRWP